MSEPGWGSVTRRRLVEDITLLWVLNEVPENPLKNNPPSILNSRRQLSVEREKEITENLAFLSATTEDSKRVTAVCIEEHTQEAGLTIRVASNAGNISEIEEGLKRIAKILEEAAARAYSKAEDSSRLLRQVVIVDYCRILQRLRSKHAPRRNYGKIQHALIPQLNIAVNNPSIQPNRDVSANTIVETRNRIAELQALFERFEAITGRRADPTRAQQDLVMDILERVYHLKSLNTLVAVLSSLSGSDLTLKEHLPKAIGKLGRYYSTSRDLVKAARDRGFQVFKRILVEAVRIPRPSQVLVTESLPFKEALQLVHSSAHLVQRQRLTEYLETEAYRKDESNYRVRFICKNSAWKVHAEVQLLIFYELNPSIRPPRVICSSKSACYLCNLFFKIHGQYWIPNSHGRLYDRWVLPDIRDDLSPTRWQYLCSIVEEMDSAIQEKIMANLGNRQRYNDPNESILVPSAVYSSTTSNSGSLGPAVATAPLINHALSNTLDTNRLKHEGSRPPSPGSDSGASTVTLIQRTSHGTIQPTRTPNTPSQAPPPPAPSPPPQRPTREEPLLRHITPIPNSIESHSNDAQPCEPLNQGQILLQDLSHPHSLFKIRTPRIHLSLTRDHVQQLPGSVTEADNCWVKVKWLDADESERMLVGGGSDRHVVDVKDLARGEGIMLENGAARVDRELFLRGGRDVLSVKFGFEGL